MITLTRTILTLLLITCGLQLFSQTSNKTDSLWRELRNTRHDTEKVKYYKEISWELIYTSPDSSISLFNKALEISEKHQFATGKIYCLNGLARAYWVKGDFPVSMDLTLRCLNLCDSTGNSMEKVRSLNMLGLVYYEMNLYERSIDYFKQAMELEINIGDSTLLSRILGNIGDIYIMNEDTIKAYDYYERALNISRLRRDDMNSSTNYLAIGRIYRDQNKLKKAEEYLKEGLRLAEKVNDNQNVSQCLTALAMLYLKTNEHDKCMEFSEKALSVARSVNDLNSVYESAYVLYQVYNKEENFKEALKYYLIADAADDSMFNSYQNDEINRLQHSFDISKKEAEIEILSKDKKLAELQAILFGSGFVLLLILGIVIFRSRQKTYKAKILLEKQKKEIEEQNDKLNQKNEEIGAQRDEIAAQRDIVTKQKQNIEKIYTALTDSIHYAKRIQKAVLPEKSSMEEKIGSEFFILYKPKDIVSGDFYYVDKRKDLLLIAVADCTGHGVPGAFMSMLGISFLNEIISKEEIQSPDMVLEELRRYVIRSLQQKSSGETGLLAMQKIKDGMDISFISINTVTRELQFAGANNPLYIVSSPQSAVGNGDDNCRLQTADCGLIEIKGDKMPASIHLKMNKFTNHSIQLNKGDMVYLMTDGFADQFGGKKGRKFMAKNLKQLIIENCTKPMNDQKEIISNTIEKWRIGFDVKFEQTDDITLLGIKVD